MVLRVNQRSGERVARTNRITIKVQRVEGETEVPARLVDVSPGGVGFVSAEPLVIGERLRIRVELETTQIVSQFALFVAGLAVVRRSQEEAGGGWRYGAAWSELPRAEREKWVTFLGKTRALLF